MDFVSGEWPSRLAPRQLGQSFARAPPVLAASLANAMSASVRRERGRLTTSPLARRTFTASLVSSTNSPVRVLPEEASFQTLGLAGTDEVASRRPNAVSSAIDVVFITKGLCAGRSRVVVRLHRNVRLLKLQFSGRMQNNYEK